MSDTINNSHMMESARNNGAFSMAMFLMGRSTWYSYTFIRIKIDKSNNDIYGLLIFTEYPIDRGSPIRMVESGISEYLSDYKQVNGHSFIIDERLRNSGIDKKMLHFNTNFLIKNYDFIWIGVEESLRSKSYWERLGFTKVFEITEATFYLMPLSKKMINEYL